MNTLASRDLTVGYDRRIVVEQLSVSFPAQRVTSIVGANGCGKSTVLKAFSRILAPVAGQAFLDGVSLHSLPSRTLAQRLSVLPQSAQSPDALTVEELVSYGRYPHRRWFGSLGPEDRGMVEWALDVVELKPEKDRPVNALSGGQQQRVWIAMTLAQGADILLLDEPTTHLDLCHQLEIMELLARLNDVEKKTVVMVLHDLNLAARYSHHMIAIRDGAVLAQGTPDEVMTPRTLREVFGIDARIERDERTGTPVCVAYPIRGTRLESAVAAQTA